eukprot:scpid86163/ scgid6225/ 
MDSCTEVFGSGDSDSIFLDQHSTASSSPAPSRHASTAISPTSLPSAGSSPRMSSCRNGFVGGQHHQGQRRSPRLSSNASIITSSSEASASSSGSNHSNSSRGTASWGSIAKHRPLKSTSDGDDGLLKVVDNLRHASQSLRQVVSSLAHTYDDDVLHNVQQFNEQARAAENGTDAAPRQHLKLRRQTQGEHHVY